MTINVVKIGGNVIDSADALESFIKEFAQLPSPKVLVHGGGKLATAMSKKLGIETHMIDGRRVTDKETLDIVTMVYAGLVNKNIVAKLQREHCNSIGLCGADGNVIPAVLRSHVLIDFRYVGYIDAEQIDVMFIQNLLQKGITPVFCALTHDRAGDILNSNADSVTSAIAIALTRVGEVDLTFCMELPGVMRDTSDMASLISHVDADTYDALKQQGVINKGMIPKIDNAFAAVRQGVRKVIIKKADNLNRDIGTTIQ